MRYSDYVKMLVAFAIAFYAVFSFVFIVYGGWSGIVIAVILGPALLFGLAMAIAWAHRAVSEFHGSPFPGIWGVLGFSIEPDHPDLEVERSAERDSASSGTQAEMLRTASEEHLPDWVAHHSWTGETPPVSGPLPKASGHECSACGAVTEGSDSSYCRKCGTPFAASSTPTT